MCGCARWVRPGFGKMALWRWIMIGVLAAGIVKWPVPMMCAVLIGVRMSLKMCISPSGAQAEVEPRPRGVVEKCTFCNHRIDRGLAQGLMPGVDQQATPACVNACPVGARVFGDINDAESPVSKYLAEHDTFRLREDFGTEPKVHYVRPEKQSSYGTFRRPATARQTVPPMCVPLGHFHSAMCSITSILFVDVGIDCPVGGRCLWRVPNAVVMALKSQT